MMSSQVREPSRGGLDWPPSANIDAAESYEKYAEVYDALFDDLDADAAFYIAQAGTHVTASQRLLELGIGTGRLTARLLAAGHRVAGLDSSAPMLERAVLRFGASANLNLVQGDVRAIDLAGEAFPLVIAPYGMVAHLLTNDDRLAAFRSIYEHVAPGGVFVFDDHPAWLDEAEDDTALHVARVRPDGSNGDRIRLMTNTIDAAGAPVSVRYDIIDRIDAAGRIKARTIVRIVFRNIALADELALLAQAGFARIDVMGGFDGRPLDRERPTANERLVLRCHRDR